MTLLAPLFAFHSASSPSIRILATSNLYVHVLSLVPGKDATFGLQHQVLSAHSGSLLYQTELPDVSISRERGAADVIAFSLNPPFAASEGNTSPPEPHVVWLQSDGSVRSLALALPPLEKTASFKPKKVSPQTLRSRSDGAPFSELRDVSLPDRGFAIAVRKDSKAEVIRLRAGDKGGSRTLTSTWEFDDASPDAIYAGHINAHTSAAYINRVFFQRSQHLLNFHNYWTDAYDGTGQVTGFSFRWDHDKHGDVLAAPFEANQVSGYALLTRSAFVTSSGSFQMIQEDRHQWINEEGLIETSHVAFVDLPRRSRASGANVTSDDALRLLQREGPIGRIVRHVTALADFPLAVKATLEGIMSTATSRGGISAGQAASRAYDDLPLPPAIAGEPAHEIRPAPKKAGADRHREMKKERVKGGKKTKKTVPEEDEAPAIDSVAPRTLNSTTVTPYYSDKWGARQLMISATAKGKLYAQDTGMKVQYVWESSLVGFGQGEGEASPFVEVKYMGVVREAQAGPGGSHRDPLMYIVGEVTEPGAPKATLVWELNPITGEFIEGAMTGKPLALGGVAEVRKLPGRDVLAVFTSNKQVVFWPRTSEASLLASQEAFRFTEVSDDEKSLTGYTTTPASGSKLVESWSYSLPAGEKIISTHQSSALTDAPIASLGRSINDWYLSRLPKLLDPNVIVVVAYSEVEKKLTVHLVDQITGNVLSSLSAPNAGQVDITQGAHVAYVENWLTLGYTVRNEEEGIGSRVFSIEYYDFEADLDRSLSNWFLKSLTRRADINSKDAKARGKATTTRSKQVRTFSKIFSGPSDWEGVKSLGFTETLYNAADRALLVLSGNGEVHALPRRLLDPRRPYPKGSPALAGGKQDRTQADSLLPPYDALLLADEKRTLTHGINILSPPFSHPSPPPKLISRRTKLESTTLVALVGSTDFFLTKLSTAGMDFDRLSPTFNKMQLVGTTGILALGILVSRPLLKGKALRARWV